MTQKSYSSSSRALVVLTKKSPLVFYRHMLVAMIGLLLCTIFLTIIVAIVGHHTITPPIVIIWIFVPSWILFSVCLKKYMDHSYKEYESQV